MRTAESFEGSLETLSFYKASTRRQELKYLSHRRFDGKNDVGTAKEQLHCSAVSFHSLDYFQTWSNPESYNLKNKGTKAITGPVPFQKVLGTNMYF